MNIWKRNVRHLQKYYLKFQSLMQNILLEEKGIYFYLTPTNFDKHGRKPKALYTFNNYI